jgi:hypothetical protein
MAGAGISGGTIIPLGDSTKVTRRLPHLIDAISDIQQFYIFESTGQEIPHEFLTIKGSLSYFNIGFGSGFFEGLMFSIVLTVCMPFMVDTELMRILVTFIPFLESPSFVLFFSAIPVIFACVLCCWLAKYYVGSITRRAIDNLLLGRATSLFLTGFLLFTLLTILSSLITPERAFSAGMFMAKIFPQGSLIPQFVYETLLNLPPIMVKRAIQQGVILCTGVVLPYITIWAVIFIRRKYVTFQNAKIGK